MCEFRGNQHVTVGEDDEWTEDQLVTAVQELETELGRPPTTRDADRDDRFPGLTRLYRTIDDWPSLLERAGVNPTPHQRRSQRTDRRIAMWADLRRVATVIDSDYLTTRQYDDRGEFATSSVKARFGSWADACAAAGIMCGKRHGVHCRGPRGAKLASVCEQTIAEILFNKSIEYDVHPSIPETNWAADFYIPQIELWLEVDGYTPGTRPNKRSFEKKLEHYSSSNLSYAVVATAEELRIALRSHGIDIAESR